MLIYLAGKVGDPDRVLDPNHCPFTTDWRFDLVDHKFYFGGPLSGFKYSGPRLENCHTQMEIDGHDAVETWATEDALKRKDVFERCIVSISLSDIVFAWIFEKTCFGTMAEIGFAFSKKKTVLIGFASQELRNELWFLDSMARSSFVGENPKDCLMALLKKEGLLLSSMPYSEYLKTDHWKTISKTAREKANCRCQVCNANDKTLHIHHRTYERRGYERIEDLICLCSVCHRTFHDKERAA